ncbi:MAG: hypothetical protein ACU84Q_01465 [Gammaproteobacteria bacterium]
MNIEEIGSLGEAIAAAATIVTLLFVAFELRANRRQNKLIMLSQLDRGWNDINAQISQDESLADIFNRGMVDPDSLTEPEATRFFLLMSQYINHHKSVWTLLREEGLDTHHELWIKYDISGGYNMPGMWKVFQCLEPTMAADFVAFARKQRESKVEFINWRSFDA